MSSEKTLRQQVVKAFTNNLLDEHCFDWNTHEILTMHGQNLSVFQNLYSTFSKQISSGTQIFELTAMNPDPTSLVKAVHFTSTKNFMLLPRSFFPELNAARHQIFLLPRDNETEVQTAEKTPANHTLISALRYAVSTALCNQRDKGAAETKILVTQAYPADHGTAKGIEYARTPHPSYLIGDYDDKGTPSQPFEKLCTTAIISRNRSVCGAMQTLADVFGIVAQFPVMQTKKQRPLAFFAAKLG